MSLASGLPGIFPDIGNATKLLKKPGDQYNFAIDALLDYFRIEQRTRKLAAEFIEQTGRLKDSPSEVVNDICELLRNAFNIGDHCPLDGCGYELFKNNLAPFWNQHGARTRTRDEMVVKDTTSGNELLVSQRLRRDECDTLVETCRLLGVSWHTVFRDIHASRQRIAPVVRLTTGVRPGRDTLRRVEQTPEAA